MGITTDRSISGRSMVDHAFGQQRRASEYAAKDAVRAFEDAMNRARDRETAQRLAAFEDARGGSSLSETSRESPEKLLRHLENNLSEAEKMSDSLRLSERMPRMPASETRSAADSPRRESFEKALQGIAGEHDLETGALKNAPSEASAASQSAAGLSSLFADFSGFAQAVAPQGAVTEAPMSDNALESLVSRILVSSPDEAPSQVRITLNDNVLRSTEIVLTRDLSGALSVLVDCRDRASFQTLVASRNALVEALEAHEKGAVCVQMSDSTESDEGDTSRRSRGLDAAAFDET